MNTMSHWENSSYTIRIVAKVSDQLNETLLKPLSKNFDVERKATIEELESHLFDQSLLSLPEILIIEIENDEFCFEWIRKIKQHTMLKGLIVVLVSQQRKPEWLKKAKELNVHDYYAENFPIKDISERLVFLVKFKLIRPKLTDLSASAEIEYKIPIIKRIFDIVFSGGLLLVLSPVLLIIALLIRLDSKGPIVYKSKRVGTGYKIFDFYKFRSMYSDADKRLADLKALNQYSQNDNSGSVFVKLKNDPRVTKIGRILRKTSLDELPQLVNILKGDMSTVGNRPLPLYEAEQLTSNEWAWRFIAPAGLTGLWQISKRGKEDMSERERKKLDNFYAKKFSIWFDLKILFKTIPAMFQHEDV